MRPRRWVALRRRAAAAPQMALADVGAGGPPDAPPARASASAAGASHPRGGRSRRSTAAVGSRRLASAQDRRAPTRARAARLRAREPRRGGARATPRDVRRARSETAALRDGLRLGVSRAASRRRARGARRASSRASRTASVERAQTYSRAPRTASPRAPSWCPCRAGSVPAGARRARGRRAPTAERAAARARSPPRDAAGLGTALERQCAVSSRRRPSTPRPRRRPGCGAGAYNGRADRGARARGHSKGAAAPAVRFGCASTPPRRRPAPGGAASPSRPARRPPRSAAPRRPLAPVEAPRAREAPQGHQEAPQGRPAPRRHQEARATKRRVAGKKRKATRSARPRRSAAPPEAARATKQRRKPVKASQEDHREAPQGQQDSPSRPPAPPCRPQEEVSASYALCFCGRRSATCAVDVSFGARRPSERRVARRSRKRGAESEDGHRCRLSSRGRGRRPCDARRRAARRVEGAGREASAAESRSWLSAVERLLHAARAR